jgi:hypothetical protein
MYVSNHIKNRCDKITHPLIKDLVYAEKNHVGEIVSAIWRVVESDEINYAASDFKKPTNWRGDEYIKIHQYVSKLDKFKTAIEIASDIQTEFGIEHSFTKWAIVNMSHRNELTISTCKANNCLMYKKR